VLALCAGNVVAQCAWDPQLGLETLPLMLPVLAAFFAAGRLVRGRNEAMDALGRAAVRLREQRERTALIAVCAERARIVHDLAGSLPASIDRIAITAADALGTAGTDPAGARRALASIEQDGRTVLRQMRGVLGSWQQDPPDRPQPALRDLAEMLGRTTPAHPRLAVYGSPRPLPAGLELSAYRIVENLLSAVRDRPDAAVAVTVGYRPDVLELGVTGPAAPQEVSAGPVAAARVRAAVHGAPSSARSPPGARGRPPDCHWCRSMPSGSFLDKLIMSGVLAGHRRCGGVSGV
jgi:hypothetical protein